MHIKNAYQIVCPDCSLPRDRNWFLRPASPTRSLTGADEEPGTGTLTYEFCFTNTPNSFTMATIADSDEATCPAVYPREQPPLSDAFSGLLYGLFLRY